MAVATTETVRRIRQLVRDDDIEVIYEDEDYYDAVQFALEKLTFDFGASPGYSVDTDVPSERRFLLVKLAAIHMAYVRATDAASGDDPGDITMIAVPDLTVQEGATTAGADVWLDLADRLQKEYDGEVGTKGSTPGATPLLPEVQSKTLFRKALRSGARASYGLDQGIAAPSNFVATLSGGNVVLTWDPVFDDNFERYELFRALAPETLDVPEDTHRFRLIADPHGETYGTIVRTRVVVDDLTAGTWQFCIASVSDNTLHSFSDVVTVVVP
jgi:hypothetical protein